MSVIRWGVIGAGGFADRRAIPGLVQARNATLQAVMVRDQARAESLARKHAAPEAYDDVDALLASPNVDAVYICSPVDLHRAHAERAACAGKHILCEKPMALSLDDCRAMIEVCARHGVRLGIGYMMRYRAQCQVARRLIDEGKLGQLVSGRAQNSFWYADQPDAWRQDVARNPGGVLADVGVHCIDTLRFLMGEVRAVQAMIGARHFGYVVEDTAQIILKFENGTLGMIDCSWAVLHRECPLEVYGTQGALIVTRGLGPFTDPQMRWLDAEGTREVPLTFVNAYTAEFEAMGDAILDGHEPEVNGAEGLRITEILLAAYRAAENRNLAEV